MAAPEEEGTPLTDEDSFCEIEGTVVTGFEIIAKDEAAEKLGVFASTDRGKITFTIRVKDVHKILELQCIDNLSVIISRYHDIRFADTLNGALNQFACMVPRADWVLGLDVWSRFIGFSQAVSPLPGSSWSQFAEELKHLEGINTQPKENDSCSEEFTKASAYEYTRTEKLTNGDHPKCFDRDASYIPHACSDINSDNELVRFKSIDLSNESSTMQKELTENGPTLTEDKNMKEASEMNDIAENSECAKQRRIRDPTMPRFRATCYRSGGKHIFQSPEAATRFGGTIQDYFGWNVDLKNFDIEVILTIEENHVYIGISLTKESQHRRHLVAFGPTTLRPTIAFNMLRLCSIKPGDVVCDPMCGGGTIPIEAALNWPDSTHLCGDYHEQAVPRTCENISALNQKRIESNRKPISVDIVKWNACELPLKNSYVDVFVTDLPFGKRSGSKMRNWQLYPLALTEMARVCKPHTGRACLLTQDRKCMAKTLQGLSGLWRRSRTLWVNIGGLAAGVYLLHRTDKPVDTSANTSKSSKTKKKKKSYTMLQTEG